MEKLLKTTSTDPAPGLVTGGAIEGGAMEYMGPAAALLDHSKPLKSVMENQKKNKEFQYTFSLPVSESILKEVDAVVTVSNGKTSAQGRLFLSNSFLCFLSLEKYQCHLCLPFYAIMRVERISTSVSSVSITARHQLKLTFQFFTDKGQADVFCNTLKDRLQEHVALMKRVKSFTTSCSSEELLAGKEITMGGLGVKYGYVEAKEYAFKESMDISLLIFVT